MDGDINDLLDRFRLAHEALHRCWTKAVGTGDYNKDDWRLLDNELALVFREAATRLGHAGPMLATGAR